MSLSFEESQLIFIPVDKRDYLDGMRSSGLCSTSPIQPITSDSRLDDDLIFYMEMEDQPVT